MNRRVMNVLVGFDQFVQVLVYAGNYSPDETISGIIGRKITEGNANVVEKGICWGLRRLEASHCIKSIDHDEAVDV